MKSFDLGVFLRKCSISQDNRRKMRVNVAQWRLTRRPEVKPRIWFVSILGKDLPTLRKYRLKWANGWKIKVGFYKWTQHWNAARISLRMVDILYVEFIRLYTHFGYFIWCKILFLKEFVSCYFCQFKSSRKSSLSLFITAGNLVGNGDFRVINNLLSHASYSGTFDFSILIWRKYEMRVKFEEHCD